MNKRARETANTHHTTAHSVMLRNGVRLEYAEHGASAGVPALFLHGMTDTWRSFAPVLTRLPISIRAFALTQRGHGDADRPESGYGPRDFASDAAQFLDAMAIERAIIIGHSLGAVVARRFALDYPGRTLGLLLVNWRGRPRPETVSFIRSVTDPIDPIFVQAFLTNSFARQPPPEVMEAMVQESLKVPSRVWRAVLEGFTSDQITGQVKSVTAPTLIIWGAQDPTTTRADQETLAASIPGSRLVLYPSSGHSPHWEEPQRFTDDLTSFVRAIRSDR